MEKPKPWREMFSQNAKIYIGPPLWAMVTKDGKLKLKVPQAITDQTATRGKLSLIGKVQGAISNIDDVQRWA